MTKHKESTYTRGTEARGAGVLRGAVRGALRSGTRAIACGVTLGLTYPAMAAPFPPVFPLNSLLPGAGGDGTSGFVLRGIARYDQSGNAVSSAGDVNGDGRDDLIIGAAGADVGVQRLAGESYVIFGTSQGFPPLVELSNLLPANGGDGSRGFVLTGIDTYDFAGAAVSGLGDVNGDGIDDFAIGADFADPQGMSSAGETYVVFGRDTAQTGNFPATLPLESLLPGNGGDGSAGFVIAGVNAFDQAGHSVSGRGDVNGDGIADIVVGAFGADPNGEDYAGESYVVFGRDTGAVGNFPALFRLSTLLPSGGGDGSAGFALPGIDLFDQSGVSVSTAGDVNGDGADDIVIGARLATPGTRTYAGETFVVFGRALGAGFPPVLPLASLLPAGGGDGSAGFVLTGVAPDDFTGAAVRGAGDVNGDGLDDVIVGTYRARGGAGASYVVFGRERFPAVVGLASLLPPRGGDGSKGFVLTGAAPFDYSGFAVSGAGDLNGDGVADLIVGAYHADGGGQQNAGESYVVFGRDAMQGRTFPAVLPLATLANGDGTRGFALIGIGVFDYAGYAVSAAGDMNGDGLDDLLIGALGAPSNSDRGESYVVFGRR